jgi:LEA14-like dessication related protein
VDAPVLGPLAIPLSKSGEIPVPALPQVELASFDIGRLALDQTTGTAVLKLKNTNQFALDFSKLALNFSLGSQEVGRTSLVKPLSLQPGQTGTLQVPLAFSPRAIGVSVFNLLRGDQIAYKLSGSMEANTRFGPITLPISRIGNTPVKR